MSHWIWQLWRTGYSNWLLAYGKNHNQSFCVSFFLSSLPWSFVSFLQCIRVRTKTSCWWEAPHGLQAHLVCLLSFLPIVKLNVLLWVHSFFFSFSFSFFFLFLKCATVELPHVNGAKKADNCFSFFSFLLGFDFLLFSQS